MCSSPKTQQAQQPKQNQFANSSLSSAQMASFAAVANAAHERREQRKRAQSKNRHCADNIQQTQESGESSYFTLLLRKWLKKVHLV